MSRSLSAFEVEHVARAAHEVNRTWNMTIGGVVDPAWDALTEDQKRSAKLGVLGVVAQDFNAEQSHEAWVADKKSTGWNVGSRKDEAKKEHNCLVPYSELPEEQRAKDELWVDTVRAFVRHFWRIPQ